MKYRIYGYVDPYVFESEDSFIVEAGTLEEIQIIAKAEIEKRGWKDCWSERLSSVVSDFLRSTPVYHTDNLVREDVTKNQP